MPASQRWFPNLALCMATIVASATWAQDPQSQPSKDPALTYSPHPSQFIKAAGLQLGEAGMARVEVCFDTGGKVVGRRIRQSSGNPRIDAAVAAVASQSEFRPGVVNGRLRAQCVELSITIAAPNTLEEFDKLPDLAPIRIPAKVVDRPALPQYDAEGPVTGMVRQGRAIIQFCVDETGKVGSTTIAESSADRQLDQQALRLARQFRFEPASEGGNPVASCFLQPMTFR